MTKRRSDRDLAGDIATLLDSDHDRRGHPDMKIHNLLRRARDAGDGATRKQYLHKTQKEIAKLDPSREGDLINRLQAELLALQGRGGDTEIAHVTLGEVVIPERLQTPELVAALHAAAQQAGIDPSRLVVGSRRNAINPKTGQAEFTYRPRETDQTIQRGGMPRGTQVTDVYVQQYPFDVFPFGHLGIGMDTNQSHGFYPAESNKMDEGLGNDVPGTVKNDDLTSMHNTLRIKTTPDQDQAIQDYINQRMATPGDYDLYSRNCSKFVGDALKAGGLDVPGNDMIPNAFFEALRQKYGPR